MPDIVGNTLVELVGLSVDPRNAQLFDWKLSRVVEGEAFVRKIGDEAEFTDWLLDRALCSVPCEPFGGARVNDTSHKWYNNDLSVASVVFGISDHVPTHGKGVVVALNINICYHADQLLINSNHAT